MCLNTWSPASGTVLGGYETLRDRALLEELHHWRMASLESYNPVSLWPVLSLLSDGPRHGTTSQPSLQPLYRDGLWAKNKPLRLQVASARCFCHHKEESDFLIKALNIKAPASSLQRLHILIPSHWERRFQLVRLDHYLPHTAHSIHSRVSSLEKRLWNLGWDLALCFFSHY